MDTEALMQVLQGVKRLAQGAKADALKKKYLNPAADPAADPDADPMDPASVKIDVQSDDPDADCDPGSMDPDGEGMDDDKIQALMGMMGKR